MHVADIRASRAELLEARADLPHFDRRPARGRTFPSDRNGLLPRAARQEKKSTDHFLGFRKGSIHHARLTALDTNPCAAALRDERLRQGEEPAVLEILAEAHHALVSLAALRLAPQLPVPRGFDDQQCVCHDALLVTLSIKSLAARVSLRRRNPLSRTPAAPRSPIRRVPGWGSVSATRGLPPWTSPATARNRRPVPWSLQTGRRRRVAPRPCSARACPCCSAANPRPPAARPP